jgi:hypothetical protein
MAPHPQVAVIEKAQVDPATSLGYRQPGQDGS